MKQIPNIITLLNLFFGCIAIVYIVQPGLVPLYSSNDLALVPDVTDLGTQYVSIPQQMFIGSLFIGLAAVVDFFDGFVARWMKATSPMGAELDSLADVVSFGVAPSLIVYQFLRLSFAQQDNGLDTSIIFIIPAFIIACAGAYRLARFNIDTSQTTYFKGVPIPANGLVIASFPLIYWTNDYVFITRLLINPWFWYAIIIILSWLMVSKKPMLALKFSGVTIKKITPFIIIALIAIVSAFFIQWLAVPVSFMTYVILSLLNKQSSEL
ncbi:MAG: CDP-alcohol phosphatidyltransferase family protein [Bacteroidetes bacterium]|nr:CDP-alcohol phosphatidyltransferase family protein [Bacteroidota bacterium]